MAIMRRPRTSHNVSKVEDFWTQPTVIALTMAPLSAGAQISFGDWFLLQPPNSGFLDLGVFQFAANGHLILGHLGETAVREVIALRVADQNNGPVGGGPFDVSQDLVRKLTLIK